MAEIGCNTNIHANQKREKFKNLKSFSLAACQIHHKTYEEGDIPDSESDADPKDAKDNSSKDIQPQSHRQRPRVFKEKRRVREKRRSAGVLAVVQSNVNEAVEPIEKSSSGSKNKCEASNAGLSVDCLRSGTIDADNPQTPVEPSVSYFPETYQRGSKSESPSDLDADLEDNRDYDSCVSQTSLNWQTASNTRLHEDSVSKSPADSTNLFAGARATVPSTINGNRLSALPDEASSQSLVDLQIRISDLERMLAAERDENLRLRSSLASKDSLIDSFRNEIRRLRQMTSNR